MPRLGTGPMPRPGPMVRPDQPLPAGDSATGPRTLPTEPKTVTIPSGESCSPSKGAPGFTVTDTRTLRDLKTGEVRTDPTRTVRYNPSPIVECGD